MDRSEGSAANRSIERGIEPVLEGPGDRAAAIPAEDDLDQALDILRRTPAEV